MENNAKLLALMEEHQVGIQEVADILGKSTTTIKQFRSKAGANITDNDLELLTLKLKANSDRI